MDTKNIKYNNVHDVAKACFEQYEVKDVLRLCKGLDLKYFKKNEVIFKENTELNELYFLKEGKVKLHKSTKEKTEHIIRFSNTDELLGIETIIAGGNHLYSATALKDLYLCRISKGEFYELMLEKPGLYYCLLNALSCILHEMNNRNFSILQKSELERLAEALIILQTKYNIEEIKLLKKDLANYTNIGKNQIKFYLNCLKKERLISFNSERIKIINLQELQLVADGQHNVDLRSAS